MTLTLCVFVCIGEIILKQSEEKKIRKDRGVSLVDWRGGEGDDVWEREMKSNQSSFMFFFPIRVYFVVCTSTALV